MTSELRCAIDYSCFIFFFSMKSKICSKCKEEKDIKYFPFREKSKGTIRGVCKRCSQKKHLSSNKTDVLENEVWRNIPEFKKIYQISNLGRIKTLDHIVKFNNTERIQYGRILKFNKSKKGYYEIWITKLSDERYHTGIHRLVALAFIPNPENKPQVNHINGIKTDNRVENLEWCSNKENQIHAINNNLTNYNFGEKHHNSRLSNLQISQIREAHKNGEKCIDLAKKYNITASAMSNILRNKTYKTDKICQN